MLIELMTTLEAGETLDHYRMDADGGAQRDVDALQGHRS